MNLPTSRIMELTKGHLGGNVTRKYGTLSTLEAVVAYLKMLCPNEGDLLLFSDWRRPDTDTGRLFAVSNSHAAILEFGDCQGRFSISGPVLPLSTVKVLRLTQKSTAWPDDLNDHEALIEPVLSVEFESGDVVSIGEDDAFGWTPRSVLDDVVRAKTTANLSSKLLMRFSR